MLAYVLISLRGISERDVFSELEAMDRVKEVHILFGEWDLIIKVEAKSPDELATFVMKEIRNLQGVNLTSTLIAAK